MAHSKRNIRCKISSSVILRSSLLLSLVLIGSAASHAQAAAQGHNSSSKRHLQQGGLLPDPLSNNPSSQQYDSSSTTPTCWGWKSTQCLTSGTDKPAFALLGDSITDFGFRSYGWAGLLAAAYGGAVNMVNYGIPGATTRKVDILLDKFIQQWGPQLQQVRLVVICFGANDAVKPHAPLWHLPIPKFKENLQRMVKRLQEKGVSRIVLVTPPPVGQRNDRDNALTANYAAAVMELAQELQLESVDVYSAIMGVDQWKDEAIETDQLHLSSVGQKVFFDSVLQLLTDSADLSPAVLGARQQQQQTQLMQQQQRADVGGPHFPEEGGKAMSNVLSILLGLAFLLLVTEAQRMSQSLASGDIAGRKTAH